MENKPFMEELYSIRSQLARVRSDRFRQSSAESSSRGSRKSSDSESPRAGQRAEAAISRSSRGGSDGPGGFDEGTSDEDTPQRDGPLGKFEAVQLESQLPSHVRLGGLTSTRAVYSFATRPGHAVLREAERGFAADSAVTRAYHAGEHQLPFTSRPKCAQPPFIEQSDYLLQVPAKLATDRYASANPYQGDYQADIFSRVEQELGTVRESIMRIKQRRNQKITDFSRASKTDLANAESKDLVQSMKSSLPKPAPPLQESQTHFEEAQVRENSRGPLPAQSGSAKDRRLATHASEVSLSRESRNKSLLNQEHFAGRSESHSGLLETEPKPNQSRLILKSAAAYESEKTPTEPEHAVRPNLKPEIVHYTSDEEQTPHGSGEASFQLPDYFNDEEKLHKRIEQIEKEKQTLKIKNVILEQQLKRQREPRSDLSSIAPLQQRCLGPYRIWLLKEAEKNKKVFDSHFR